MHRCFIAIVALLALLPGWCAAQDEVKATQADAAQAAEAKPVAVTAEDYPKLYREWKEIVAKLGQLRARFQTDPSADKKAVEAEFNATLKQAQALADPLGAAGEKAFAKEPNKDKELAEFLVETVRGYIQADDYEKASRVAKLLVEKKCDHSEVDFLAGIALFNAGEFELAGKHLQIAKDKGATNEQADQLLGMVDKYKEIWAKEQAIRAKEDKADNLPKIKLTTSKGDIVVVLFENEAPIATANFITLVEKKYYDGLTFHRVLPGFMAQGGDPNGDGSGGPGYTIPDECREDDHRNHFRGSLSMAKTAAPDTGGSQFFLTFVPTTHLDGKHTVFGRVVEGIDVLAKLQKTQDPSVPADKIITATVLRKRNHPYKAVMKPDKK